MNSRMEKYDENSSVAVKTRETRNKRLYEQVQNLNVDYIDTSSNNAVILNPDKINSRTRTDYQIRREIENIIPNERKAKHNEYVEKESVNRVYDINEILRLARDNKLFPQDDKKRLLNTEYNILTKLDIEKINNNDNITKEGLRKLIDKIYSNDTDTKRTRDISNEDEDLLSDLVATKYHKFNIKEEVTKQILEDKLDNNITVKIDEKKEEELKEKQKQESNTNIEINKKQFEDEEDFLEEEKGKGLLIFIIFIVILLLGVVVYLFLKYFGTI